MTAQATATENEKCPCGSGKEFGSCCAPLLEGKEQAETAEQLMRSRYTAFAVGNVDYIFDTHDPDTVHQIDRKSTETWSKQSEWLGLEILSTNLGGPDDYTGTVEFLARYKARGTKIDHREVATFRKHNGAWLFVDGEEVAGPPVVREGPRVGRNDPCPCGSGKKYKKCCGKAA